MNIWVDNINWLEEYIGVGDNPVNVCVEVQGSAVLIITRQPSPPLTFLTSLQRLGVGRLCYRAGAGFQHLFK